MIREARSPIEELSEEESRALLMRQHIGRMAFSLHDRVDLQPISYSCDANWIYLRTADGNKVNTLRHHSWVAFQVDDIRGPHDWDSVVVFGRVEELTAERSEHDRQLRDEAIEVLRRNDPNIGTEDDIFAFRTHILRLHIDQISGRRCHPGGRQA